MQNKDMISQQRPLSPHLTIYKAQLTATLSIFHRISGFVLFLCLGCVVLLVKLNLFFLSNYYLYLISSFINFATHWLVIALVFIIFLMLNYHLLNGIRHLIWDVIFGLDIKEVYLSGYIVVILTFVLTYFLWFFLF
jgi:succinate dehydrogenase / fumarate reductase, cytochrome b subunit